MAGWPRSLSASPATAHAHHAGTGARNAACAGILRAEVRCINMQAGRPHVELIPGARRAVDIAKVPLITARRAAVISSPNLGVFAVTAAVLGFGEDTLSIGVSLL